MRNQKPNANKDKPEVTYHYCQVTGFGTRMVPPLITEQSRMSRNVKPGYLIGYINTRSQEFRVRTIDVSNRVHPSDRVYYPGELPTIEDHTKIIQRMAEEYTILEERVIVNDYGYDDRDDRWHSRLSLAPRDFQIPVTISASTQPDNVPVSVPEETATPLAVPLGELVKSSYQKKKERQRSQEA